MHPRRSTRNVKTYNFTGAVKKTSGTDCKVSQEPLPDLSLRQQPVISFERPCQQLMQHHAQDTPRNALDLQATPGNVLVALEKAFPDLSFRQQPLQYRQAYNREAQRKTRVKLPKVKVKVKVKVEDLPRDELLARRRQQRQQQRAAAAKARAAAKESAAATERLAIVDTKQKGIAALERKERREQSEQRKGKAGKDVEPVSERKDIEHMPAHEHHERQKYKRKDEKVIVLKRTKRPSLEAIDPGTNVTFQDNAGKPILQIFAKGRQQREHRLNKLEVEGSIIFDQLWHRFTEAKSKAEEMAKKRKTTRNKANGGQETEKARRLKLNPAFGLWHSQGCTTFGFTHMSKKYRDLSLKLLDWGKRYTRAALVRQKVHPIFQKQLLARRKIRPQLQRQFGDDADLLHTFWSTLFLFKNATSNAHTDTHDENPSLLFNFGGKAWLVLPEFGAKIRLHPLDTAIFASSKHKHYTLVDSTEQKRWAIGGFMRTSVFTGHPLVTFSAKRRAQAKLKTIGQRSRHVRA